MSIQVLHFDVFTMEPGKGNPAGIVLAADGMSESTMQAIAARTGFPDTAFVLSASDADFGIRYFNTQREVELCGHATIAAAIALHARGRLTGAAHPFEFSISTRAGILPIRLEVGPHDEQRVVMAQASSQFRPFAGDLRRVAHTLGIELNDLHSELPVVYGSTGRWTLVVPVNGLDAMRRMVPNTRTFAETLVGMPGASIHPFCLETVDPGVHMHARHFSSPSTGTIEDPVTGTASGVLGTYSRTFVEKGDELMQRLVVEQGREIGREGRVLVWAEGNAGSYMVRIAGTACFVAERTY